MELSTRLDEVGVKLAETTNLRHQAEEEVTQQTLMQRVVETEIQKLRHEVLNLNGIIDYLRNTTASAIDEFLNRLKHEVNLFPGPQAAS